MYYFILHVIVMLMMLHVNSAFYFGPLLIVSSHAVGLTEAPCQYCVLSRE